MQYLIAFCSQLEVASDAISGAVLDNVSMNFYEKFGDSS